MSSLRALRRLCDGLFDGTNDALAKADELRLQGVDAGDLQGHRLVHPAAAAVDVIRGLAKDLERTCDQRAELGLPEAFGLHGLAEDVGDQHA